MALTTAACEKALRDSWARWASTLRASWDSRHPELGVEVRDQAGHLLDTVHVTRSLQDGLTIGVLYPEAGVWLPALNRAPLTLEAGPPVPGLE